MSNIEKIKAAIERLKAENRNIRCQHNENYCTGYDDAFSDLLSVIDSLPEEKPSEDLEEAAENLFETIEIQEHENIFEDTFKKIFIAGAERQKAKMMKDAVEGEIVKDIYNNKLALTAKNINLDGFKFGDKVKMIIVKEE